MSSARSDLAEWFEKNWGETLPDSDDVDLFEQYGIDGDDAGDFMEGFVTRFGVNADSYRWYFHHRDEGTNFGALLYKPIYKRVNRIPITPDILVKAIETKQWPIKYPHHELPPVRWDIRVNQLLLAISVAGLALWLWRRFVA